MTSFQISFREPFDPDRYALFFSFLLILSFYFLFPFPVAADGSTAIFIDTYRKAYQRTLLNLESK